MKKESVVGGLGGRAEGLQAIDTGQRRDMSTKFFQENVFFRMFSVFVWLYQPRNTAQFVYSVGQRIFKP